MKKCFLRLAVFLLAFPQFLSFASENSVPEPFRGEDPNSKYEVVYDDIDELLYSFVTVSGWSDRKKAPEADTQIGTRLRNRINRLTALEGNRFFFSEVAENEELVTLIHDIKKDLEALPDELPLNQLKNNEQLAYWINLYNITVMDALVHVYPRQRLQNVLNYGEDDSLMAKKLLTVSGVSLSLDDIQFTILKEKFNANPLIIYGLWQGNIGGPSLTDTAYKGNIVWRQLEANAKEFVNSNRGTRENGEVSVLYERNMDFFANNKNVLISHLMDYLEGDFYNEFAAVDDVSFEVEDWTLAALMTQKREYGKSANLNPAAFIDAFVSNQVGGEFGKAYGNIVTVANNNFGGNVSDNAQIDFRFSNEQMKMLQLLRLKHDIRRGKVEITDLEPEDL